jgi:flavin reductase (DIM6/NTAB) family NADH-FMN oxidoreductase RutF
MKIEIGSPIPGYFMLYRRGQYELIAKSDFARGIPGVPCAATTLDADGKPRVSFGLSACFTGYGDTMYAVVPADRQSPDYKNILRAREFVVNFFSPTVYNSCLEAMGDSVAFEEGVLHPEPSAMVSCPRIREAFLSLECRVERRPTPAGGRAALIIGRVSHATMSEEYADKMIAAHQAR